jgi:hypothetical protein
MEIDTSVKNIILTDETKRYCEIYKITNIATNKLYVGQAVSHILNHKKYRPYGMEKRLACHISEAFSSKKNQSQYLNNAIKKYGPQNFKVELIRVCTIKDAEHIEKEEIIKNNSLYPNGYNLNTGGKQFAHTDESKKRVSTGVMNYSKDKKMERFIGVTIDIKDNIKKYIHPLNREGEQYGWYILVQKKKADFGGVHISLDDSYKMATDFLNDIVARSNPTEAQNS